MKTYALVIAAMVSVSLAGCRRTVDTVHVGDSYGDQYKWVQTDSGMGQIAKVISARKQRVNDLLKVQVELMNTRKNDERFVYKWVWLDADGLEITSITNTWNVRVINAKETIMLSAIAPDPRVTDARLLLQESVR
jgi:uncharacterized protein YcfL